VGVFNEIVILILYYFDLEPLKLVTRRSNTTRGTELREVEKETIAIRIEDSF